MISRVDCELYRVPMQTHVSDAMQTISTWEWVVATICDDDGPAGVGFTYTLGLGGSALRELVRHDLAPMLIGKDASRIESLWQTMWRAVHANGPSGMNAMAVAAVDVALHDLAAKRAGLPLYRHLGATRDSIPVYASGIDLHLEQFELLEEVRGFIADGYTTIKIKVGRSYQEDLARVAAVRKCIGNDVTLLLDANQAWNGGEAVRRAASLEQYAPGWLEEPVLAEDLTGNASVRTAGRMPIALGETLFTRYEFERYISGNAVDVVQADILRAGGLTEWRRIARLAGGRNLPMAPHFCIEVSIHALCSIDNSLILENVVGGSLHDIGLTKHPVRIENGLAYPSEQPGHGVEIDTELAAKYLVVG